MSQETFERLISLFDTHNANYRVVAHEAAGSSDIVAKIRGTELGQGAKAMICRVKISSHQHIYVHAVIPGDRQVDFHKIAAIAQGKKASLATPEEAQNLTDCVMGAVPPVSFNPDVMLVVDETLIARNQEIAFNAGLHERSIIIQTQDYLEAVKPKLASIIKD